MRLLLAAISFVVVMGLLAGLVFSSPLSRLPFPLLAIGIAIVFVVLLLAIARALNPPGTSLWGFVDPEERMRMWEAQGLLTSTEYRARRAFGVQEFEDLGPHYFLELEDGTVLHVSGQYLYEYEPIDEEPELKQPRRFPCTEFTLKRHRDDFVVDLDCRGELLEPEVIAPPFTAHELSEAPEDGEVITDHTYDEIKAECLKGTTAT